MTDFSTEQPADPLEPGDEPLETGATPPAGSSHRRALVAGAAVVALVGVLVFAVRPVAAPAPSLAPGQTAEATGAAPSSTATAQATATATATLAASGFIADRAEIEQRVARAHEGVEPYATALEELIAFADEARFDEPRPREPLNISGTDGPFVEDAASAYGLALAYVASGDVAYAEAARRYLMAWATTNRTTRNTCTDRGCQTSLIISRNAPAYVFAADLIKPSGVMSAGDETTFRTWLRDVILPTASERDNNWGDAGTFTRMALNAYLGDAAGFDAAVARWREMLDFLPADGHIPEEVRRESSGIMYTQEALQYKIGSAVIAARRGIDLWDYKGKDGGTLRGAIDYLVSFFHSADQWPWNDNAEFPRPSPMWELVYAHWPDPRYAELLSQERPFSEDAHSAIRWTTLTNGIPLVGADAPTSAP